MFNCDNNCALCTEDGACQMCKDGETYDVSTGCCGSCATPDTGMPALGFDDDYDFYTVYDDSCDFCGVECTGNNSFDLALRSILAIAALMFWSINKSLIFYLFIC